MKLGHAGIIDPFCSEFLIPDYNKIGAKKPIYKHNQKNIDIAKIVNAQLANNIRQHPAHITN